MELRILVVVLLLLQFAVHADNSIASIPKAFERLGKVYSTDLITLAQLRRHPYFNIYINVFDHYETGIGQAFSTGFMLDRMIEQGNPEQHELKHKYLSELRRLQEERETVQRLYRQALSYAMDNRDLGLFELLLQNGIHTQQSSSMKRKLAKFYERQRKIRKIEVAEELIYTLNLEEQSMRIAQQELDAYEENLRVIAEAEAKRIRKMTADKRYRNVIVSTQKKGKTFAIIGDNLNTYRVTITLEFHDGRNIVLSESLPYSIVLEPKSTQTLLDVSPKDSKQPMHYRSTFSWVMGSYLARHDHGTRYTLPFQRGTRVLVSQGFNGNITHTARSRYAVDFSVPEGTPIHAARGGKVVSVQVAHDKGGFKAAYRKFANYIIIEHDDMTLGRYYHLKKDGSVVQVGQEVLQGQLIGYSGNTGFSSGPHLHFSVSSVDPQSKKQLLTLPIRFYNDGKFLSDPKRGDVYTTSL